jgi:FkbM family methyltransferase
MCAAGKAIRTTRAWLVVEPGKPEYLKVNQELPSMRNRNLVLWTKALFRAFNIGVISYNNLQRLIENNQKFTDACRTEDDLEFLLRIPTHQVVRMLHIIKLSKSQIRQDLFVLSELDFKKRGFFVEFGATNGLTLSNTYLLEKEFEWEGILVEPAKCWHQDLYVNRTCRIETKCVWSKSNTKLTFIETDIPALSTIDYFRSKDWPKNLRQTGNKKYEVETISLLDLLDTHRAPQMIDYLSIDTEGSEFEILSNFDFDRYQFRIITCEHNHTPIRQKIHELLTSYGYTIKFDDLSRFDDWYVMK